MTMQTIHQVGLRETKERIIELEEKIRNDIQQRIDEFESSTGLGVMNVHCQFMDCRTISNIREYYLSNVDVTITYDGVVMGHGYDKRVF